MAWMFIIGATPLVLIIVLLLVRRPRGAAGSDVGEGIKKIIASTGDVSAGMAGAKKLKFLKTPAQALVFLKVEENAIQQALSAIDYYHQQGDIDESVKDKLTAAYQNRLSLVKEALAKDEQLKEIVDTSSAVDRARSDYLAKLAAMSGTAVEDDASEAGPTSVGMPDKVTTTPTPPSGAPSDGAPPSGGPPGGGPPGGGPPGGGPPSGGPPGGGPPSGGAPDGAPPSGPPGGAAPSDTAPDGGPPGGAPPSGGPPGGPPGGDAPSGPPGGTAPASAAPKPAGGKSSLQSEMLAEMERLKALMGGD